MSVVLEVRNLSIDFGGLKALDSVQLSVNEGEIFGIIGPNGAGKTTLFNAITGLVKLSSGQVNLYGKPIHFLKHYAIAQLGVGRTFQIVRPFANLTVLKNVLSAHGSRFYRSIYNSLGRYNEAHHLGHAREILKLVGLDAHEDELAKNLPLGLQRRLEIARVLALEAKIMLLDESFSGLSHEEAEALKWLILDLKRQGKTIMVIEHNMPVAMDICERIAVLNYGRKIAEGKPEEISSNAEVIEAYLGKEE